MSAVKGLSYMIGSIPPGIGVYERLPLQVLAVQLSVENMEIVERWCGGAIKGTQLPPEKRAIDVQTHNGEVRAKIGDWIIRDAAGKFYPCNPDIFDSTYRPIDQISKLREESRSSQEDPA